MGTFGLLFVGAVYLANGLVMLGRMPPVSAAPVNLAVGLLLIGVSLHFALQPTEPGTLAATTSVAGAVGYFLFGLTYLYVGICSYTGHSSIGLGWYCGWATIASISMTITQYFVIGDARSALLWFVWIFVFLLFFLQIVRGFRVTSKAAGWFIIVAGFSTCLIPAWLMMIGSWTEVPIASLAVVEIGSVVIFAMLVMRSAETSHPMEKDTPETVASTAE